MMSEEKRKISRERERVDMCEYCIVQSMIFSLERDVVVVVDIGNGDGHEEL